MQTHGMIASVVAAVGLAVLTTMGAAAQERPAEGRRDGPAVRRVLGARDADPDDFVEMSPSPDGRRVAFVNMSDGSVRVRDFGTGEVRQLVGGPPAVWHTYPRWSRDGRRLAVATEWQGGATSIQLIDVATRSVEDVPGTLIERGQKIRVAEWSKDGRALLCTRGNRLVYVALPEGTMTVVADGVAESQGSLSPDGRFAVYAAHPPEGSGVFISPVAGGTPRRINALGAQGGNPMWSPDGDAIAYESDDGIWVVPVREGAASGTPRHALVAGGFTLMGWTTAGLYFTVWGENKRAPYQIRMNPATGEAFSDQPETLPGGYPDDAGQFAWSPDMQRVAFSHFHPAGVSIYPTGGGTVVRIDLGRERYAELPSWSADGHEVLIHTITPQAPCTDTVRAVDPTLKRVRDLEPRIPDACYAFYSADGRTVLFARQAPSVFTRWQIGEIRVGETGMGDGHVVAAGDAGGSIINNPAPRLSPRGNRVAYVRQDRGDGPPGPATLWIVGSDGRGARQLATVARITSMVWDPSGRFVAYVAWGVTADSPAATLRVVDVETGADKRIPLPSGFPGDIAVVDWSRDGSLLGIVASTETRTNEYWVAQALIDGGR